MKTHKCPVTVITGFLGSGKTTLIRHLLTQNHHKKIALIINEFGDLGMDQEILKGCQIPGCDETDMVELANGCICCTVADDFVPTLEKLMNQDVPPDCIVIETSGLALPEPLVHAFQWPDVKSRFRIDGVVAVVDGPAVHQGLFACQPKAVEKQRQADAALDHQTPLETLFHQQVECADMVLMSKQDQMSPQQVHDVKAQIAQVVKSKNVPVIPVSFGKIDPEILLDLQGDGSPLDQSLHMRNDHHHHHDHDHNDFETFIVPMKEQEDKDPLIQRLQDLCCQHSILRIKGLIHLKNKPMRYVVQGVGQRIEGYFDRPWASQEERQSYLVIIGLSGLDRHVIEKKLNL